MQLTEEQITAIKAAITLFEQRAALGDYSHSRRLQALIAAHNAGAQEPVAWLTPGNDLYLENPGYDDWLRIPLYTQPQPMPQTDAARDAEDAKRYRFIKSQMKVGAVQTQLPLYRTLHWIGDENCSDVHNADAAIDAEIERLDRAKGE